jgi:cell division protein FtsA
MNSIQSGKQSAVKIELEAPAKPVYRAPVRQEIIEEKPFYLEEEAVAETKKEEKIIPSQESTETKIRRSFFDKYVEKIKDFLENAE